MALKRTYLLDDNGAGAWVQEKLTFDFSKTSSTSCLPVPPKSGVPSCQSPAGGLRNSSLQLCVTPTHKSPTLALHNQALSFFSMLRNLSDAGGNNDPVNRVAAESCSPTFRRSSGPLGTLSCVLTASLSHFPHQPFRAFTILLFLTLPLSKLPACLCWLQSHPCCTSPGSHTCDTSLWLALSLGLSSQVSIFKATHTHHPYIHIQHTHHIHTIAQTQTHCSPIKQQVSLSQTPSLLPITAKVLERAANTF